jgi:hypothetical protein
MIWIDGLLHCTVENYGLRNLISHLEQCYTIPERNVFSNKVIPDIDAKVHEKVKENLAASDTDMVSVTTDMWTSVANQDYLSLTVHYFNSSFVLNSMCIEVVPFPEVNHTASNLWDFLMNIFKEWGLAEKVQEVMTDNGRNMVIGVEM